VGDDQEFELYVGIDWADKSHQVCVCSSAGKKLVERSVEHDGRALASLADDLIKRAQGDASRIAVAIETPRGPVVSTLLERGMSVFSVNPKQLDRFRDRHTVAGAKDDRRDAFVLADSLRTDGHLYRRVKLADADILELRELVRLREDLLRDRNAYANRLRDQLTRYYVQFLELGSIYDDLWLWDLLDRAPTPAEGAALSIAKIRSILNARHIRRIQPEQVREILRRPALVVAPGVVEASAIAIKTELRVLRTVDESLQDVERRMEERLEALTREEDGQQLSDAEIKKHRDARVLLSFPGIGTVVGATMLSEGWEPLVERDYRTLRAECGIAPVTHQSGRRKVVSFRRACNRRLREAVFHFAQNAVRRDERAREHYATLRARGASKGRALRGVADRLLEALVAMLRNGTPFDPARRSRPSTVALAPESGAREEQVT
jgi:transposase